MAIPGLLKLAVAVLVLAASQTAAVAAGPDFQREIQPILAEHCAHCHGVDAETRQGDLRLDIRQAALEGGESGAAAIVAGRPDESEMVRRIRSDDPDEIMPPPHEKKPLSPRQVELLEQWIAAGATYDPHWAFVAPRKLPPPAAGGGERHPIDAFVHARLTAEGILPSPSADDATLCRRLHLDLIGLPPSPDDLAAFERDGYEKTVDRLLASQRYGEKWGRHWLDLARYSDTNGYEKDLPREQWTWRDWVIAAINRDMPYDEFIVAQIAGDLLPAATTEQVVATGFLRNSMLNEEGAIVPEEFRMVEMFDRIDCVGKSVLGLTTQCAQCHTHKFDPLTHDEYYGVFAFLNNSYESISYVPTPEQQRQIDTLHGQIAAAEQRIRGNRPGWEREAAAWEANVAAGLAAWAPLAMEEMESVNMLNHPAQLEDRSILMIGHRDKEIILVTGTAIPNGATGLQVEALTHGDLFMRGPGRDGPWELAEVTVFSRRDKAAAWEAVPIADATADFSQAERRVPRPAGSKKPGDGKEPDDGTVSRGPVANLIDGDVDSSWAADRGHLLRNQPSAAVLQFGRPLDLPAGSQLKIVLRMNVGKSPDTGTETMPGCCRLSLTTHPAPSAPAIDHAAILAIRTPRDRRTPAEVAAIFAAWRKTVPDLKPVNDEIDTLWKAMPVAPTTVLHLAEREPGRHRATHLLDRGVWNRPLRVIGPHVPAALHPFPDDAPRNRLGFARWLVDPRSPLTARVAVNRIWQTLFGQGLVDPPDDFGTRTPVPAHKDLLDWLAVDFMERGWSQKQAIRQIVMSETYRQSSRTTPDLLARDPANRLLARGPRFRVDAEVVRDIALAVSGLITHKLGGPGVIPPVPQNVLDYNYVYPKFWKAAEGPERYRRAVYLFRKRSMPDPVLGTFDSPNGDLSCARRLRSNTPLAALTGLNEPVFVEAARALALRVLREEGDDDGRAHLAFVLCTSRPPTADERREMLAFLAAQRRRLADGWVDARDVAGGGEHPIAALPAGTTPQDAAAWTLLSRVLLNLDETVTKN
jgi:mono/diheme cytochrome c family protein